jgi:hypothetical protein
MMKAAVEGLITGQCRKPCSPMSRKIVIDAALAGESLQMTENVHGQEFLIGEAGLEIAQALLLQERLIIVEGAD